MNRDSEIIRASLINIVGNVLLATVKGVTGLMVGSIAFTLDAINSLTDALSSVIAILGTKLAAKAADRDHPFGYGRVEYLSSIVIAVLILTAGITSFIEAIKSIIHPAAPEYTVASLVVMGVAAAVKFGLGFMLMGEGNRLESGSLLGSGTDSLMDGGVSLATCVAGILYMTLGWQIESWLAAGIALLIVKGGISLLADTSSKLLGERVSPDIATQVEREAREIDGVRFASGVVLMDFGPNRLLGAMHVTVDGQMTVAEFDSVARAVQERIHEKCGVTLAGVTPYADLSSDETLKETRMAIAQTVWLHEDVLELRGLYVNPATATVRFDAISDFDSGDTEELRQELVRSCEEVAPGWTIEARVLPDIGD